MENEQAEKRAVESTVGMRLAFNVRMQGIRPELLLALMVVSALCNVWARSFVVTAILNGTHMRNSLHYTGAAVDFVVDLAMDRTLWLAELRDRLGADYDVIDEGDHIHLEYQPHLGALT